MTAEAKSNHYARFANDVQDKLRGAVDPETIRSLHEVSGARHARVALRLILSYGVVAWLLARFASPFAWIPLGLLQGTHILGFTILLHEVVHGSVFKKSRPRLERFLGLVYALPAAMSATQFTRWHLDHHAELGSNTTDPKRAYLTPKIVKRWYKALYCTPFLFAIYARASAREAKSYPPEVQRTIAIEKRCAITAHLLVAAALAVWAPGALWRVWVFPLFFAFPPAFVINRLGQHYDIDPSRPEAWSTRIDGDPLVRYLFLASNHHLEHHYYPGVPLYRLERLNRLLRPFYERNAIADRSYLRLLWGWFVRNETPHTAWKH